MIATGSKYLGADSNTHKGLVNYYNWHCSPLVKPSRRYKMKLSDNWCAMFVSVLAHEIGLTKEEFPYEVSVFYMCELARERGQFSNGLDGVRRGDLVVYDWTGRGTYDHIGVVSFVGSGYIEVLEGNYNKSVGVRTVKRTSKAIKGVISLGSGSIQCESKRLESLAVKVLRGEFGNGATRRDNLGADFEKVQKIVNTLL